MSSSTAWTRPKLSESRRTTSSPCTIMRTAGLPTDPTRGTDCCPTRPSAGCAQRGGNRHHKDCRQPGRHRLPHAGPPPADKSRRIAPHRTAEASACEACVHGTTASLQPAAQLARAPTRLTPNPGWQPDPAWGPLPAGWVLWLTERANPRPFRRAFLAAGSWLLLSCLLLIPLAPAQADVSYLVGRLTVGPVVAAVTVGFIARSSRTRWAIWKYFLWTLVIVIALTLMSSAGYRGP